MIFGKHIVALCISKIHDSSNHDFISSFSRKLAEMGYRLFIFSTTSDLYWNTVDERGEKTVYDLINYDVIDAVVIHDESIKDKDLKEKIIGRSREHGIPVVTIGSQFRDCSNIRFNYTAGFEKVVRHVLIDHKVTDFHFIAGQKGNSFSDERIKVIADVAKEAGISFDENDISYGEFWSQPTERAVEALFRRRRRLPQAIICANDTMAITTVNVLKKHGVKVPDDIIVTGFDGINDINYCSPRITTCLCSNEPLAKSVSDTVYDLVNGCEMAEQRLVIPDLKRSESCGCNCDEALNPMEELIFVNNSFYRYQSEEEQMFRMMSRILECQSFTGISEIFDRYDLYDTLICLNPECMDATIDPLSTIRKEPFDKAVSVVYNSNDPDHDHIAEIDTVLLHPDMESILENCDTPLILFSLNYMGNTMGYCLFSYHNFDIQNFYKASQIVSTLNCAFGAFRTIKYQNFLSEKIEEMYRCDGLTHLLNRLALKNSYTDILGKCNGRITVALADLDGLKFINDQYGHDDGDFAICTVANALKNCCPKDALCVRWGGDEMVALIPGEYPADTLHTDIDKFISDVNASSGKSYSISASVGVMSFEVDGSTPFEDMVRATDNLMYNEKKRKKALSGQ